MKSLKIPLLLFAAVAATTVLAATAIHWQKQTSPVPAAGERRFEVRGQIRELDIDSKTIRIAHEEIPGYMAAMTMPFQVKDTSVLHGLKVGDDVGFLLVVTDDDSWIRRIIRVESTGLGQNESAEITKNLARLQTGECVPDFSLVDQNGCAVRLKDYRGKAVLLTFIYTRCPLPNFCPLMSKNFASLQERLHKEFPGKFHLLSVSIDPEFDKPEVLKNYSSRWSTNEETWTFSAGTRGEIEAVGGLFGLVQESANGLINHDLRTALIGPDGRLVHLWKSNMWTPYEVHRRVAELFQSNKPG
jgi:protein SCO1